MQSQNLSQSPNGTQRLLCQEVVENKLESCIELNAQMPYQSFM